MWYNPSYASENIFLNLGCLILLLLYYSSRNPPDFLLDVKVLNKWLSMGFERMKYYFSDKVEGIIFPVLNFFQMRLKLYFQIYQRLRVRVQGFLPLPLPLL